MKESITWVLVLTMAAVAWAQDGSISPYSSFGVGEFSPAATIENRSMGSSAVFGDSIHINLQNPSAYGKLRVTTYALGLSNRRYNLKEGENSQELGLTNLEYLGIAFPVHPKAAIGFGIMPYSAVGYRLETIDTNAVNDTITNTFNGEGSLNRVYLSAGANPIKDLYVGASVRYNFGTLQYNRVQSVQNVQYGTRDIKESRINGFDFNYALTYTPIVYKNYRLHAYLGIDTQVNLVSQNTELLGSFQSATDQEIEQVNVDLEATGLDRTAITIPTQFSFGLGAGIDQHWFASIEYRTQDWSDFSNDFLDQDNIVYSRASSIRIGGYYVPKWDALSGFYNRMVYRAGIRFAHSGTNVNGEDIRDFGITFGLGVPIGGGSAYDLFSNLNIGFEFGRRGTTNASLVQENYTGIAIGLSLNDRWFIKRRIN